MEGKDEHGVSLVSASDNQYEVSARAATAGGSALLACVIEQDPGKAASRQVKQLSNVNIEYLHYLVCLCLFIGRADSTDPIYLPSVSDRDLGLVSPAMSCHTHRF